jgi:dehydrogenase/reductase SDR family member 12
MAPTTGSTTPQTAGAAGVDPAHLQADATGADYHRGPGDVVRGVVDGLLEATVFGSFTKVGFATRRRLWGWDDLEDLRLEGKVVVVTGANSGLGYAAATRVARAEADVHLVVRDRSKGETAAERIGRTTGRTPAVHVADLSDPAAVVAVAAELRDGLGRLDGLVHNAGAMFPERVESTGGLEASFGSMVFGPHVLTHELQPVLEAGHGRVVWVTSGGMYTQRLHLDDLQYREGTYKGATAYARAKRAQVDLAAAWAERVPAINSWSVHPGWADTPGVEASLPGFRKVMGPLLRSPDQGADTIVWLLASREPLAHPGALWFDRRPRGVARAPRTATTPADRERLWAEIERMRLQLTPSA